MFSQPAKSPKQFRPDIESLEDRCLLNCTFREPGGNRLMVIGDDEENSISIFDNGTQSAGNIIVQCDGQTHRTTSDGGISEILVYSNEGEDRFAYNLTSDLRPNSLRSIWFVMGEDDDSFQGLIGGDFAPGSRMRLNVIGQGGEDSLALRADAISSPNGVNLTSSGGVGSSLQLRLDGNDAEDAIFVDYVGQVAANSRLTYSSDAGDDEDEVAARVALFTGSLGLISTRVFGGDDDDELTHIVQRQSPQGDANAGALPLDARVNGGNDFDVCTRTPNVSGVNCNVDRVV